VAELAVIAGQNSFNVADVVEWVKTLWVAKDRVRMAVENLVSPVDEAGPDLSRLRGRHRAFLLAAEQVPRDGYWGRWAGLLDDLGRRVQVVLDAWHELESALRDRRSLIGGGRRMWNSKTALTGLLDIWNGLLKREGIDNLGPLTEPRGLALLGIASGIEKPCKTEDEFTDRRKAWKRRRQRQRARSGGKPRRA